MQIEAIAWSEEVRMEKDQQLCEIVGLLQDRAVDLYGEPSVRRLRLDFLKGRYVFRGDSLGRKSIESLLSLENEFLRAYICLIHKLSKSYYNTNRHLCPDLEVDDYRQVACLSLLNAVYHYDGSTKFITYVHNLILRSFSNFVRDSEERAGVGRKIKKLRRVITRLMSDTDCSLAEAIESLKKDVSISKLEEQKLVDSVYKTIPVDNEKLASFGGNVSDTDIDVEKIRLCIDKAQLSCLERGLIEAYMQDDTEYRNNLTRTINPNTGRNYTRQSLSQVFLRACNKIECVLRKEKVAA